MDGLVKEYFVRSQNGRTMLDEFTSRNRTSETRDFLQDKFREYYNSAKITYL